MHMLLPIGVDEMVALITHLSINFKLDSSTKNSQVCVSPFQGTSEAPQPGHPQHGPLLGSEQVVLLAGAEYHGRLGVLATVDDHPGSLEEHLPHGAAQLAGDDV